MPQAVDTVCHHCTADLCEPLSVLPTRAAPVVEGGHGEEIIGGARVRRFRIEAGIAAGEEQANYLGRGSERSQVLVLSKTFSQIFCCGLLALPSTRFSIGTHLLDDIDSIGNASP